MEDLVLLVSKIPEIYESSNFDEKRKVLKLLYSNFLLEGKNPLFSIRKPLENILSRGFRQVWSGRRDWLDFLLKNLRRCVGFIRRYSRLAMPPCQTRFLACSNPIARNLQTQKSHPIWWLFVFVVGATRFEHATSWSQTKRSTRLSYTPSTECYIYTIFSLLQVFFYFLEGLSSFSFFFFSLSTI